MGYLGLNLHKAPLDKLEVRKAIAMAINKQAIADSIFYEFRALPKLLALLEFGEVSLNNIR